MSSSDIKVICRNMLGRETGTLREVFANLMAPDSGFAARRDPHWGIQHGWVALPDGEGEGGWNLLAVGERIYAIMSRCVYTAPRFGEVPAEGLVGLHFVMDGPVEVSGISDAGKALAPVSMLAYHPAPGVALKVSVPAGISRMITVSVAPDLLQDSFGLAASGAGPLGRLAHPAENTIATFEAAMSDECAALVEALLDMDFNAAGSLPLAMARLVSLIGQAVAELNRDDAGRAVVSYSQKDLLLLERARAALAADLSEPFSLAVLAKRLGTNQTKLKTGLRAIYGISASNYRRRCRMIEAQRLLGEEGRPVSQVAALVGYSAHASFTVAFKAHFGHAPIAARAEGRRGQRRPV